MMRLVATAQIMRCLSLVLTLLLAGCGGGEQVMNRPLNGTARNAPDLWDTNLAGGRADMLVLVAFSGGGKRSAAFGHGALRGMRALQVPGAGSLLDEIDSVSGVSGGSFPAAHFALNGERSFETFGDEFLHQDIESWIYGTYLLPWNWGWIASTEAGTNDRMAQVYDRLMFRGATFADLRSRARPLLSVNATDVSYGIPFAFTPGLFDLICSDLGTFPLARAVAASNGFPGVFTPITIENHRGRECSLPAPIDTANLRDSSDRRAQLLGSAYGRYLSRERTRWVHLMDGGISDNLAMRHVANSLVLLENQAPSQPESFRRLRRILVISVDGEASTDPTLSQRRTVNGLLTILGAVSGGQIDNYNAETLLLVDQQLLRLRDALRRVRCAEARRIEGAPCEDVEVALAHVALSEYPDEETRRRLSAIRTGLTIPPEDSAQLVAAGEAMIARDAGIAQFLRGVGAAPSREMAGRRQNGG